MWDLFLALAIIEQWTAVNDNVFNCDFCIPCWAIPSDPREILVWPILVSILESI